MKNPKPAAGRTPLLTGLALALLAGGGLTVGANEPTPDTPWSYQLIAGAQLLDDCSICDRPPILIPLRGQFEVAALASNPLFTTYAVRNLRLTDGAAKPGYEVIGEGEFRWGGEVALVQEWTLEVTLVTPAARRPAVLRNPEAHVTRGWPMLGVELVEEGGTPESKLFVTLPAAPLRELWFTTVQGMTSGLGEWPTNRIRNSDLLAASPPRVVRQGPWLMKQVGIAGDDLDADLDAFTLPEGRDGEIWFSLDRDVRSGTLGALGEGDLLSTRGAVVRRNAELLAAFGFMPPVPDLGLDAVLATADGFLFSIRKAQFSERLGTRITPGDLLASEGTIVRRQAELLARFEPLNAEAEPGLNGFYLWPSGEIWFTTEEGFETARLGQVMDGDLLSDQGYVVARSLDLVREFQPLEDLANFGLQGFWVISDATATSRPATLRLSWNAPSTADLTWKGAGRVHQVEATAALGSPFRPVTPLLPETTWSDPDAPGEVARYYRVRSW